MGRDENVNNDKKSFALQYEEARAVFSSDPMRSFHCMQSLAEKNFPLAIFRVGWHFYTGTAVEADVGKAEACFKRVIDSGSAGAARNYAVYYYGMVYFVSHDFDKAREIWELGDRDDYPPTVYWLARMYRKGEGVAKDPAYARELYERAASRGLAQAKADLTLLLLSGRFGLRGIIRGFRMAIEVGKAGSEFLAIAPDMGKRDVCNAYEIQKRHRGREKTWV